MPERVYLADLEPCYCTPIPLECSTHPTPEGFAKVDERGTYWEVDDDASLHGDTYAPPASYNPIPGGTVNA